MKLLYLIMVKCIHLVGAQGEGMILDWIILANAMSNLAIKLKILAKEVEMMGHEV